MSQKPFGGRDAEYRIVDGEYQLEISSVKGKFTEGTFSFRVVNIKTKMTIASCSFKAEDRQL